MKTSAKRRPAEYLTPDLNPERVARMWGVVEASQKRPGRSTQRTLGWAMATACAAALCIWGFAHFTAQRALQVSATGDVIVTQQKGTSLNLPDGSALVLSEAAKLAVVSASATDVSLHLERGRVTCDVTHVAGRRFTVEAMGITASVLGTHFSVEVSTSATPQVTVHVERGVVEVRDRSQQVVATMTAGQTWSGLASAVLSPVPAQSAAPAAAEAPASAAPAVSALPSALSALDAGTLFERANAARIAGRASDAAADYDRFRLRFPQDSRAGLSAFELGRIRLDSLHDPRRALAALGFALSHNRGGFASEDAQALRVDALSQLGDQAACSAARSAFISAHPASAHVPRVTRACSGG